MLNGTGVCFSRGTHLLFDLLYQIPARRRRRSKAWAPTIASELLVATFQHVQKGDQDFIVRHIRLVHISGIGDGSGRLTDALDAQRILVDETDRTCPRGQMKSLLRAGYTGPFSYECTSPTLQNIDDLKAHIDASITYLSDLLDPQ